MATRTMMFMFGYNSLTQVVTDIGLTCIYFEILNKVDTTGQRRGVGLMTEIPRVISHA